MSTASTTVSNTLTNASPVNSSSINAFFDLNGVPLFTYVMIGITTVALACVTMLDDSNKSYAKDEGFFKSLDSPVSVDSPVSIASGILPSFGSITPEAEKQEAEKQEAEKQEAEKEEAEKEEAEKEEAEKEEAEKQEAEKQEAEKEEAEKEEAEKQEAEKEEAEKKDGGRDNRKTKTNLRKYKHNKSKKVKQYV